MKKVPKLRAQFGGGDSWEDPARRRSGKERFDHKRGHWVEESDDEDGDLDADVQQEVRQEEVDVEAEIADDVDLGKIGHEESRPHVNLGRSGPWVDERRTGSQER